jgi:hypothetical protein
MAVTTFPRTHARAPRVAAALPPGELLVTLLAPALDLLRTVLPGAPLGGLTLVASIATAAIVLLTWARFPRTSWLAAATLAGVAGVGLRLVGADGAPALSLLAVLALGAGGAFASSSPELSNWLEVSPASLDGSGDAASRPTSEHHQPPRAA